MSIYRIIQRAMPPTLLDDTGPVPSPFAVGLGGDYYHVEPRYVLESGDTLIADDVNGAKWTTLLAKAPAHAQAILRALVYRNKAGTLRAEIGAEEGVAVEKKVPQSGQSSKKPVSPDQAAKALNRAKALHAADPETVQAVSMSMSAVLDGDVVDTDMIAPHHWSEATP